MLAVIPELLKACLVTTSVFSNELDLIPCSTIALLGFHTICSGFNGRWTDDLVQLLLTVITLYADVHIV